LSLEKLRPLLDPTVVAVIGASGTPGRPGFNLTKNILDGGFDGRIFPVNPKASDILGLPTFAEISLVPERVDLAFIVLNRVRVKAAVEECARAGVRAICIITAGFAEGDAWGIAEQEAIAEIVARHGMVGIGPNTIGLVTRNGDFVGSFVPFPTWAGGNVAIIAQTGIYAGATAHENVTAKVQRLGIHMSVDIGNRVGISELDLLDDLAVRDEVTTVGFYVEEFSDPRGFLGRAAQVKRHKPVVVLKTGRTLEGARASASHTGSMGLDDDILEQLFAQHGIQRAADEREFLDILKAFSYAPIPAGNRVGVVTFSGALGVIAVDHLTSQGLQLAGLDSATGSELSELLPGWQSFTNPADLWSAVEIDPQAAASKGFRAMLADPAVDQVMGVLLAVPPAEFEGFRELFSSLRAEHPEKPIHVFITGGLRGAWTEQLEGLGIPVYESIRQCVRAMAATTRYSQQREIVPSAHGRGAQREAPAKSSA
jgi:acyl-CoA synthetase (NDP forming)